MRNVLDNDMRIRESNITMYIILTILEVLGLQLIVGGTLGLYTLPFASFAPRSFDSRPHPSDKQASLMGKHLMLTHACA